MTCRPAQVPFPISSLTDATRIRATVKPSPMPIPSKKEATGPCFPAYASARPMMMQFTTISGI